MFIINRFSTPPANDGNRVLAMIIDYVVAVLVMNFSLLIPFVLGGGIFRSIFSLAMGGTYLLLRDALPFLNGQSVGKKLMGIRAVKEDGSNLINDWRTSALRNLPLIISPLVIVELIIMLTNRDRQRLGDQWARTRVIAV